MTNKRRPIEPIFPKPWDGLKSYGSLVRAAQAWCCWPNSVLNRLVALKIPRPEVLFVKDLRHRFVREAQAAARLKHPNLVSVHEAGEAGTVCYIASTYCDGPNLSVWLKNNRGGCLR